jgi:hypothetical protein
LFSNITSGAINYAPRRKTLTVTIERFCKFAMIDDATSITRDVLVDLFVRTEQVTATDFLSGRERHPALALPLIRLVSPFDFIGISLG